MYFLFFCFLFSLNYTFPFKIFFAKNIVFTEILFFILKKGGKNSRLLFLQVSHT